MNMILDTDIYFEAIGIEEGILVTKGKSLTKVDEKNDNTYEVAKTFSALVKGDRLIVEKGDILEISEKEESSKKKYKVMYESNEMEIEAMDMDECKKSLMEMAKIEEIK